MASLPVISFEQFSERESIGLEGESAKLKRSIVQDLFKGCHEVGFFYLKDHGINQGLIDRIFDHGKSFFLKSHSKDQFPIKQNRGYTAINQEILDPGRTSDFKEAFNFASHLSEQENLPAEFESIRNELEEFIQEAHKLCRKILRCFALAMEIPASEGGELYFEEKHQFDKPSGNILRLLHYPPLPDSFDRLPEGELRAGAHSDYGSLTLLFQQDQGGLQVLSPEGSWIDAPPIPGHIIVNTGDLMEVWSSFVFPSTKHRVVLPEDENKRQSRFSMAFFCHPDDDVVLKPISSPICSKLANYKKIEENRHLLNITAKEHLLNRLNATYF